MFNVKSSQKGWEIGFPLAGWGNDDKVPLLLSSINFVILLLKVIALFSSRDGNPFSRLNSGFSHDCSILSLLQCILLILINIFCAHSRFFCDPRPQLTTVKPLQMSADLMRARLLRSGIGALGSILIAVAILPTLPSSQDFRWVRTLVAAKQCDNVYNLHIHPCFPTLLLGNTGHRAARKERSHVGDKQAPCG